MTGDRMDGWNDETTRCQIGGEWDDGWMDWWITKR